LKSLKIIILILPLAELAAFIAVAAQIGILATLALTAATSLAGMILLRMAGRQTLAQVRALADGRIRQADFTGGFFRVLAGILLVLPGFVTDLAAVLLLLPPLQKVLRAALVAILRTRYRQREGVVDLEPGEWNRVKDGHVASLAPHERAQSLSPGTRCVSHTGEQSGAPSTLRPEDHS
jgi:UPF0716 protein FxsA